MGGMHRIALPLVAAMTLLALAGCASDSGGSDSGTGSASLYVKDAPSDDFREVHVLVTEGAVHRSSSGGNSTNSTSFTGTGTSTSTATGTSTGIGNTSITASVSVSASASVSASSSTGPSSEAGWIVLFSSATGVDVDLMNTTGAQAAFLGEADLAAGHYQQIRLTVLSAWGIKDDGSRVNITVSSGTVKVVKGFDVEGGMETRITLDVDLGKSLKEQGNGSYRLTPVIGKTSTAVVDDDKSGEDTAESGEVEDVPESA